MEGAFELIKGKYYDFSQFKNNIEGIRSTHVLPSENLFSKVPEKNLIVRSSSKGFETQMLSIYNPSDATQTIDLSDYYLKPLRPDVQRIALASVIGDVDYYAKRLNEFFKTTLGRLGTLYPKLKPREQSLVRKYPYESLLVAWYQFRSDYAMGRLFEKGSVDGEADAFRHFVWAGFLTNGLGQTLAERYLDAHESEQEVLSPSQQMDLFNNKKGVEAALSLGDKFTADELYLLALKSLKNKDLVVLRPSGKIPDDSSY